MWAPTVWFIGYNCLRMNKLLTLIAFLLTLSFVGACSGGQIGGLRGLALSPEEKEEDIKNDSNYIFYNGVYTKALDLPRNELDGSKFVRGSSGRISYGGDVDAILGVDVSGWMGTIDWEAVAEDGVHFAILRAGRRGYTEGGLFRDDKFDEYYRGATAAGLDVGAYFFSQATTVAEAEEEARLVLEMLDGRALTLPVFFDWELPAKHARTQSVSAETVTRCALAFFPIIEDAGYTPAWYASMDIAYTRYDLEPLGDYYFWFAQYSGKPTYYYKFNIWQYSSSGKVKGISYDVDLNLMFLFED